MKIAVTSRTNSVIFKSVVYTATKKPSLRRPNTAMNYPDWKAVANGDSGRSLPSSTKQTAKLVTNDDASYWVAAD